MTKTKKAFACIIAIVVCELAGMIGSIFTTPSIATWYSTIHKASFNPPNWIFAPVWTSLFLLMGIAVFLVWNRGWKNKNVQTAISVFVLQLALNVLWSIAFFGLHSPLAALIDTVVLWLAILWAMVLFFRINKAAGWLLVPYIAWVSFAAVLNYYIYILN